MATRTVAQPSVMSLFLEMQFQGQTLGNGTGFVVTGKSGPLLITNWHNLLVADRTTSSLFTQAAPSPITS
jgi:hypothetical protein